MVDVKVLLKRCPNAKLMMVGKPEGLTVNEIQGKLADLSIPVCRANCDTSSVKLRITVSVGVAQMSTDIPSLDALIDRKLAISEAKKAGSFLPFLELGS